ncbi:bifunctional diguanylate cyclase/phosphodiesterase [Paenisporosarcina indica]|uniref:bifunctional diguanylate cyclase/phosphodiesterase n=1 Tax=Paenisporosarcina indica TaxID=650093 RepID=UPI00094FE5F2|nr:EAL domain-containing protein [Paenisporosarcina indica]
METNYSKELSKEKLFDWLCHLGDQYQTSFVVADPEIPDNPLIYVNDEFLHMTGYSRDEVIGKNYRILHGKETSIDSINTMDEQMTNGKHIHIELLSYQKEGTPFWSEAVFHPICDKQENLLFYIGLPIDITSRKQTEALFDVQQEIYKGIEKGYALSVLLQKVCDVVESFFQQDSKCSILLLDEKNRLIVAAARSLPESYNETIHGTKIGKNIGSSGTAAFTKQTVIVTDIETDPKWKGYKDLALSHNLRACWAVPVLTQDNKVVGTITTYYIKPNKPREIDLEFMTRIAPLISLAVKYSDHQEEVLRLAYMDADTGIPNRHYFINELTDLLKENEPGFVAIIEPTEFTNIVDVYGRAAGDEVIKQMCQRIQRVCKRYDDIVARFSTPALIVSSLIPANKIDSFTTKIMKIGNDPFMIQGEKVFLTMKIGVTPFIGQEVEIEELIRYADTAISNAKKRAGNALSFFTIDQDKETKQDLLISNQVAHALQKGEFDVHLQPKVDLMTGEIFSFEALARWNSPELGQIAPSVFIQAAEHSGKIREIDQVILTKVLTWLQSRKEQKKKLYPVAINISTDHFFDPSFVADLQKALKAFGIQSKYVRLELTESIGLVDFELAKNIFTQLKQKGFESSVDDFGMGYSSLSYLQQLPVSEIKIDRSFISNIDNKGTLAIVRTIVQLADNLNMQSIAEGIETKEQLATLLSIGCKSGQGFHFYKPMTFTEIERILD